VSTPEKVAVITGGGSGIGRACAEALAARGYRTVCCGLDRDDDAPPELEFVRLDVTDERAVGEFAANLPRVAALVNCAGMILHEGREFSAEGFRRVIDVNLVGTQLVTVALRNALAAARGSVVNLASVWSFFGSPRNPARVRLLSFPPLQLSMTDSRFTASDSAAARRQRLGETGSTQRA